MLIDTSGCKPEIRRMWDAELEDGAHLVNITLHLETFVDCPFGDRWNLERFDVTGFHLDDPGDTDSFTATGAFRGHFEDGTECTGTVTFWGFRR